MRTFCLFILAVGLISSLGGCLPAPYFQKEESIPQNAWTYNFKPTFTFDITDTTVSYKPSFLIRHSQAYPYSNLWVWVYVKTAKDSLLAKERVNIVLAEPGGEWLGRGMGEICEQRLPLRLSDSVSFSHKGTYKIVVEQNMRINPLPDIMNVGFRLDKDEMRHKPQ